MQFLNQTFDTYDALIHFLADKDLTTLVFNITQQQTDTDVPTVPDVPGEANTLVVRFSSFHDAPAMEFYIGDQSYLLVEEISYIPNTCSTARVRMNGRYIMIGVCESAAGIPVAKFDVIIDGQMHYRIPFGLVTDANKYKNTIRLDD